MKVCCNLQRIELELSPELERISVALFRDHKGAAVVRDTSKIQHHPRDLEATGTDGLKDGEREKKVPHNSKSTPGASSRFVTTEAREAAELLIAR